MRLNYLLTIAVISVLISGDCVTSKKRRQRICEPKYHKYYSADRRKCARCRRCEPGLGLKQNDGDIEFDPVTNQAVTCYKCHPCPPGQYSDNMSYRCTSCDDCSELHRKVVHRCNSTNNAVCGGCEQMYHDVFMLMYKKMDVKKPCQDCKLADPLVPECGNLMSAQSTTRGSPAIFAPTQAQTSPITKSPARNQVSEEQPLPEHLVNPPSESVFTLPVVITAAAVVGVVSFVGIVVWLKRTPRSTNSGSTNQTPSEIRETGRTESEEIELTVFDVQEDGDNTTADVSKPLMTRKKLVNFQAPLTSQQKLHIRRIGEKWPQLARVLGLHDVEIDCLRQEHRHSQGELIYQMLLKWERMSPCKANLDNAYHGLIQLGEEEIASQLCLLTSTNTAEEQR